jgi:hypothetical protein
MHLRLRNSSFDARFVVCLAQSAGRRGSGAENLTLPLSAEAAHLRFSHGEKRKRLQSVGLEPLPSQERFRREGGLGVWRKRCYSAQRSSLPSTFSEKSNDCAIIHWPVKHRTSVRHFNLRDFDSDTSQMMGLRKQAKREARSGEGATFARDGFAVPSTGSL